MSSTCWNDQYVTCNYFFFLCRYEYRWADGVTIKKPIVVSAQKYVEYLMDWIGKQLDDKSIFPQKWGEWWFDVWHCFFNWNHFKTSFLFVVGVSFPSNFQDVVKTILKRLFRVYAHIYHSHFQKIVSLNEERHLNTCFKHFVLFIMVRLLTCV